jgi:EAL domain-containing protein (putative c-di-GMP-specific phosphodiesterase class I)
MRTQVVRDQALGVPRLEREGPDGAPVQVPLEAFPFTIGRSEEADLHVDSTRVSREHAVIDREGNNYRLRDLGSTNGTFLNGRRVEQAPLADGDAVRIADVEFSFSSGRPEQPRDTATQVMTQPGLGVAGGEQPGRLVHDLRRLHEALTQVAMCPRFQPVIDLGGGHVHGYEALEAWDQKIPESSTGERLLATSECRLAARWHVVHRLTAAEQAACLPPDARVFLNLAASEFGQPSLLASLELLATVLSADGRLVIEAPDHAISDNPYFREFRARLREWGVALACDGFAAGPAQLRAHRVIAPDYVKLSPALTRDVHRHADRRRQLQAAIGASRDLGALVVAAGLSHPRDAETCRELGCQFGQGDHFGAPRPAAAWSARDLGSDTAARVAPPPLSRGFSISAR